MTERIDVMVIGGGHAGPSTSYELARRGVEHVVLGRARIGQAWRDRWETFLLVGLSFVGVHFMRKRKSSVLQGVAEICSSPAASST